MMSFISIEYTTVSYKTQNFSAPMTPYAVTILLQGQPELPKALLDRLSCIHT
jgi:hypothetical protein